MNLTGKKTAVIMAFITLSFAGVFVVTLIWTPSWFKPKQDKYAELQKQVEELAMQTRVLNVFLSRYLPNQVTDFNQWMQTQKQ